MLRNWSHFILWETEEESGVPASKKYLHGILELASLNDVADFGHYFLQQSLCVFYVRFLACARPTEIG